MRMKKISEMSEAGKVALLAFGFLTFIMLLSYLYWFA